MEKKEECKIILSMSDKVIKDHTINHLPKKVYNSCKSVHKRKVSIWSDDATPQEPHIMYKSPKIKNEEPCIELVVRIVKKTPKTYIVSQLPLVASQKWTVNAYC